MNKREAKRYASTLAASLLQADIDCADEMLSSVECEELCGTCEGCRDADRIRAGLSDIVGELERRGGCRGLVFDVADVSAQQAGGSDG